MAPDMFRTRGENLRSIYVLLFLTIAFFFLEYQDGEKFARLFAFDRGAVAAGQFWRVFTYQFTQAGQGWFSFPKPLVLFFSLLLLYIMGTAVEEEWGTARFLLYFAISTVVSAATAAFLGVALLGSYFLNFSLLFLYSAVFPQQTFYLLGIVPVRIRWIAWFAAAMLLLGVFMGSPANVAALTGAIASYAFFLSQRIRVAPPKQAEKTPVAAPAPETNTIRNAARAVGIRRAIAAGSAADIDRLVSQFGRDVVVGVNICPPADFKPDHNDCYCIRCEGFSECAVRLLKARRPVTVSVVETAVPADAMVREQTS